MSREEVIEKIKKLLRMRRGGTAAEVETALGLAEELARKHGIDLGSVNADEESQAQRIGQIDSATSARLQWECKYAALICDTFFNVSAILRCLSRTQLRGYWRRRGSAQYCVTFVGTSWDTQIAIYVYKFLVFAFRDAWRSKRGRSRNRHAFMHGMYHGICHKLKERRKQQVTGEGLVLIGKALQQRQNYLAQHFGELSDEDLRCDGEALVSKYAGLMAGLETEIRTGLGHNGRAAPMIAGAEVLR